jgi:putative hydroxymethylpyrimidine transport system substrate-binding protein
VRSVSRRAGPETGGLSLCLLMVVALFAGCGKGGSETEPVSHTKPKAIKASGTADQARPPKCPSRSDPIAVTLNGEAGAENAGLLMAEKRGFFVDAGLMAGVAGPATPRRPVEYVATGVDTFGVTQQPQLVLAREEGVPIVSIGSVIRQPTAAIIWLRGSGIRDIGDLEGKTVAVPGVPFQEDFLAAALARADLTLDDVNLKRANYRAVGALLHGRADAIFGAWNIEGAALQAQGADPVIKRVQSLGLPRYEELVVIAREECVRKHPEVMRRFMVAVARGTEAAREDHRAAANRIAEYHGYDPEFTMKKLRRQLEVTLPLLSTSARMDPARAKRLVAWMHKEGNIERELAVSDMLTNEFLARSRG